MEQLDKYLELNEKLAEQWQNSVDEETKLLSLSDQKLKRAILLNNSLTHLLSFSQMSDKPINNLGEVTQTMVELVETITNNKNWKVSAGPLVVDNNKIYKITHTLKNIPISELPTDRPLCFYVIGFAFEKDNLVPVLRFADFTVDSYEVYSEEIEHNDLNTQEFKHMESKLDDVYAARVKAFEEKFGKGKLTGK